MHRNIAHIERIARNPDLRRVCSILKHYPVGREIDPVALAQEAGLDKDTAMFLIDLLDDIGCVVYEPDPSGVSLAA